MTSKKHRALHAAAALCMVCAPAAQAELAAERTAREAPAPHLAAPGSKDLLVQHVTLQGYFDLMPNNAARLQQLKDLVPACVETRQALGWPINPPTEWPGHLNGMRTDVYVTDRFQITYTTGWAYVGLDKDCSLLVAGQPARTAILKSIAGSCRINLDNKTAKGKCDMAAHKAAAMRPRAVPLSTPARTILGIACRDMAVIDQTHCIAQGGPFLAAFSLSLDVRSEHGLKMSATAASLSLQVSQALFTPHLAGGFKIEEAARS